MSEFIIAIHALVYLAYENTSMSSETLSDNLCTNSVRIRKVMSKCKKAGLVETKAGVNGGYMIARPAAEITLKDIYEAIGVTIIESRWHSGDLDSDCIIASGMSEFIDDLFLYLNKEAVNLLANITLVDVEKRLRIINAEKCCVCGRRADGEI